MDALRIGVAVLLLSVSLSVRAQGAVFSFVDASGVLHLSNVEEDRLAASTVVPRRATSEIPFRMTRSDGESGYRALIERVAARQGVDSALLHAVIAVESAYEPMAVSRRGARGLMQLMPDTAKRYGVADIFDPAENVRAGAQYLSDLLKLFDNDLSLALAAYNAGESAVLRYGRRVPPFRETVAYVRKVTVAYDKFRSAM